MAASHRGPKRLSTLLRQLAVVVPGPCAAGSTLAIEAASGLTLGAYVRGVSLAEELSNEDFDRIYKAFLEFGVLIFEEQTDLAFEDQAAFARRFGELEVEKGMITNEAKGGRVLTKDGKAPKFRASSKSTEEEEPWPHASVAYGGILRVQAWHTDGTYMPTAFKANLLYCVKRPGSGGGETEFADMRAAFGALDEGTRKKIADLAAYHSGDYSGARRTGQFPHRRPGVEAAIEEGLDAVSIANRTRPKGRGGTHVPGSKGYSFGDHGQAFLRPLVYTHPETGRKNIFVASHAFGIPGMDPEESTELLDKLVLSGCQPPRVFKHSWKTGDLAIWDNRCILHRGRPYDLTEARVMRGTRVAGKATEDALPSGDGARVLRAELDRLRALFRSGALKPQGYAENYDEAIKEGYAKHLR